MSPIKMTVPYTHIFMQHSMLSIVKTLIFSLIVENTIYWLTVRMWQVQKY